MAELLIINASTAPTGMNMERPPVLGSTLLSGIVWRITPFLVGVLSPLPVFLLAWSLSSPLLFLLAPLSSLSSCSPLLWSLPLFLLAPLSSLFLCSPLLFL